MLSRMKRIASDNGRAWLRIALYVAGYSVAVVGVRLFTNLFARGAISLGLLLLGGVGSVFVGFAIVGIGLFLLKLSQDSAEAETGKR